jgi:hypothetical protein
MVIQPAVIIAVQVQLAGAVTFTVPVPPSPPKLRLAGEMTMEQTGDGPAGESQFMLARQSAASTAPPSILGTM